MLFNPRDSCRRGRAAYRPELSIHFGMQNSRPSPRLNPQPIEPALTRGCVVSNWRLLGRGSSQIAEGQATFGVFSNTWVQKQTRDGLLLGQTIPFAGDTLWVCFSIRVMTLTPLY